MSATDPWVPCPKCQSTNTHAHRSVPLAWWLVCHSCGLGFWLDK